MANHGPGLKTLKMKKILLIISAALIIVACKTNDKKTTGAPMTPEEIEKAKSDSIIVEKAKNDSANFTTIEWLDASPKNLGKLTKNKVVDITFRFKNSGDKILVIENVTAGCGCTIPEIPKQPYAPGEEGVIKATFNGSGSGTITKQITVLANTKPKKDHILSFSGEIVE